MNTQLHTQTAGNHEKKMEKPISIKLKCSTKEALDRIVINEDRSISYVIERCIRKQLGLNEQN
jgi:hypothetical protein